MAKSTKQQQNRRRMMRRLVLGGAVFIILAMVALAWRWQATLPLRGVAVEGFVRADSSEVVRMAAVEGDSTVALFDLESDLIADRVRRAPWVRDARVRRLPTGTLAIRVEERMPVALVFDGSGRASHYLDAEGFSLPLRAHDPFDVPLLRGTVPASHPTQPVESESLRELLTALASLDDETDALVSEITLGAGGDAVLRTSPGGGHDALSVRLGAGGYAEKLERLHAFWHQAVLTRPETPIQTIDLRFDGQIVTREADTTP